MVNNAAYQANSFLARALKKISKEKFDKMIVYLAWENVDRTNNHVERHNRVFRIGVGQMKVDTFPTKLLTLNRHTNPLRPTLGLTNRLDGQLSAG
jgi:hypothetical protein